MLILELLAAQFDLETEMFGKVEYLDEAVNCVFCRCFHGGPCNTLENSVLRNSKEGDNGEILVTYS